MAKILRGPHGALHSALRRAPARTSGQGWTHSGERQAACVCVCACVYVCVCVMERGAACSSRVQVVHGHVHMSLPLSHSLRACRTSTVNCAKTPTWPRSSSSFKGSVLLVAAGFSSSVPPSDEDHDGSISPWLASVPRRLRCAPPSCTLTLPIWRRRRGACSLACAPDRSERLITPQSREPAAASGGR